MNVPHDVDWSSVAPDWDRLRVPIETTKSELTRRFLGTLGPLGGLRVLELGAGTGELAARLAAAVEPGGSLLASDVAEGMVKLLTTRLGGLPAVDVALIDACDIALTDASVDVVVCRMGLMLMSEPDRALAEIRRVLRPGGRFGFAVWGSPQDNPWLTAVGMAAMMRGLVQGGPPTGPGGPFSLADPVDLERRLTTAGFADVRIDIVDSTRAFADQDEHFDMVSVLAPNLADALGNATAEDLAAVRSTAADLTRQYLTADGLHLPLRALVGVAS